MTRLTKFATVLLSTAGLGLVIAGCEPQGEPPATNATAAEAEATTTAEATAAVEPAKALTTAEISELFVGNTIIGVLDSWKLRWAEYFAPDGTSKALLKIEGEGDMEVTGKYYSNDQGEFCTEYPELPDQNVFCHTIFPLGDGRYQQVYADGTRGGIYNQILEGEQLDALQ